jgi:hypothetical protein
MAPRKALTVGDPTDPTGTVRPNLPPENGTGNYYVPLKCPEFSPIINLPPGVDSDNPIAIWDLFFTVDVLQIIVQNTNKKVFSCKNLTKRGKVLIFQNCTHI